MEDIFRLVRDERLHGEPVEVDIAQMEVGGEGYTVPWAASRDDKGRDWIRADYDFIQYPIGTQHTPVRRTEDCFEVHLSPQDLQGHESDIVPSIWADEQDPDQPWLLPARIV